MLGAALILFGLVLALVGETAGETAGAPSSLTVQVEGLRSEKGRVWVHLWDRPDGYPSKLGRAARKGSSRASGGRARVRFEGLREGTYAAFAFHDEDGDGRIKTNLIGMPKEGVGASKGARGFMGPPSFKAASFELSAPAGAITIRLRYL